ncbi:TRAP transporter small permease [bacterium]|nr:TRAP transporter small permease [bacterium]
MSRLEKLIEQINRFCVWISGSALILMMLLGFSNVLSRSFWRPIKGTFEIIGFTGALCTAMALGFAQIRKNHVGVDIITSKYSKRWRQITEVISCLITAPFFVIISWQVAAWGVTIMQSGETSETLRIAYYPFVYGVALGFLFLAMISFLDLFKACREMFNVAANPETLSPVTKGEQ